MDVSTGIFIRLSELHPDPGFCIEPDGDSAGDAGWVVVVVGEDCIAVVVSDVCDEVVSVIQPPALTRITRQNRTAR
jgi:hypothetical protein